MFWVLLIMVDLVVLYWYYSLPSTVLDRNERASGDMVFLVDCWVVEYPELRGLVAERLGKGFLVRGDYQDVLARVEGFRAVESAVADERGLRDLKLRVGVDGVVGL